MPEKPGEKFGDLLVKSGLIDDLQLQAALGHQRRWGGKLGQCLIDLGFITEAEMLTFLSDKFKIPAIDLTKSRISEQAFSALPESVAKKYGVVPVFIKEAPGKKKILTLAMSDPTNLKVLDEVQFLTGYKVEPVLANESIIMRVLENYGHYKHEEFDNKQRPDTARPLDFRKPAPAAPRAKLEENVEIVLGGEEPAEDMEEIVDLEEAETEGVEITPDEDVKVIRDEVVMVKADGPRHKGRVGSGTERVPTRIPIREKIDRIQEMESLSPSATKPRRAEPEPQNPDAFLNVPDLDLNPPQIAVEKTPAPATPKPAFEGIAIDIPDAPEDEDKLEIAPAHEFLNWEESPKAISMEEKPAPEPTLSAAEPELTPLKPEPVAENEQEPTSLIRPESADDDFWGESEPSTAPAKTKPASDNDESLSFERPLTPVAPPQPPSPPPKVEPLEKIPAPKVEPTPPPRKDLGTLEEYATKVETEDLFEPEPLTVEPIPEIEPKALFEAAPEIQADEEAGEMSLEFAFKKINQLQTEVKKREFQFDELLNLMMKKELGEITQELFMQELNILQKAPEKDKAQKK